MRLDAYTEGRIAQFPSEATDTVPPLQRMLLGLGWHLGGQQCAAELAD